MVEEGHSTRTTHFLEIENVKFPYRAPWGWYIYLHEWLILKGNIGCRYTYHTWMLWELQKNKYSCNFSNILCPKTSNKSSRMHSKKPLPPPLQPPCLRAKSLTSPCKTCLKTEKKTARQFCEPQILDSLG